MSLGRAVGLDAFCARLGGQLDAGLAQRQVQFVAPLEQALENGLTLVASRAALAQAQASPAVFLVQQELASELPPGRRWVHSHARWALAKVLELCQVPEPAQISASAIIESGAQLGEQVHVGPGALVLSGAVIGSHCVIGPHAVLYGQVRLGQRVVIGPGAVIGRPGFGWVQGPDGQMCRMPQLGGVCIEDEVEVGALATVDAGTLGPTRLGRGCKLDAHVHVGHNVSIGAGSIVAAQAGFAGSSRIGAGVLVGGQAGVADHVSVGDGARLAGKAGVIGDVAPKMTVAGYPAVERLRWLRAMARLLRGHGK